MTRLINADALLEALYEIPVNAKELPFRLQTIAVIENAPAVQREGWVSVPIEPTEEMIQAACVNQAVSAFASYEKWAGSHSNGIVKKVRALEIDTYKAMIQAAPTDKE